VAPQSEGRPWRRGISRLKTAASWRIRLAQPCLLSFEPAKPVANSWFARRLRAQAGAVCLIIGLPFRGLLKRLRAQFPPPLPIQGEQAAVIRLS